MPSVFDMIVYYECRLLFFEFIQEYAGVAVFGCLDSELVVAGYKFG